MNFDGMNTSELLNRIPQDVESNQWEMKSGQMLQKSKRGELKKMLGKQVSGFANSGGGNIVIGVSDDRQIEECEQQRGNQSMKDYLAVEVEQSVAHTLQDFRVFRIEDAGNSHNSVYRRQPCRSTSVQF